MTGYSRQPDRNDTDIIGDRIGAQIVDTLVTFALFVAGWFLAIVLGDAVAAAPGGDSIAGSVALLVLIAGLVAGLLYQFFIEGAWDGYTVGKKVFGIKVVKETGESCGYGAAFVRNLLGIIDGFLYYIVGFIAMAASDKRQRIGDRVAGTVVVREEI